MSHFSRTAMGKGASAQFCGGKKVVWTALIRASSLLPSTSRFTSLPNPEFPLGVGILCIRSANDTQGFNLSDYHDASRKIPRSKRP